MTCKIQFVLLGVTIILFGIFLKKFFGQRNGLPPGPLRIPFIGNLLQIILLDHQKPYAALHKLSKQYGDIMTIQTGIVTTVVISGYDECKRVLNSDDFLGRHADRWLLSRTFEKPIGILFASVPNWRESRRFTMRHLKDFGFGKNSKMEFLIAEEIDEFVQNLQLKMTENDGIVRLDDAFTLPVLNVVWGFINGVRFPHNDPKFNRLIHLVNEYFSTFKAAGSILPAYPFLDKWLPTLSGFSKQMEVNNTLHDFFHELLAGVRSKENYKTNPQTFVETFLNKIDGKKLQNGERENDPPDILTDENLISIIYDFFFAGSETTASALAYLFLFVTLNQTVQSKVQHEIYSVIGKTRWPTAEDQAKMPYTEATILETLRIRTVLPVGPRKAMRDIHISRSGKSFVIPKGTLVLVSYYATHMDEKTWGDPEVFRPNRFIDDDGNIFNTEKLIPFAMGKRNCVGESLARMTLFLFLSRLLQKFQFEVNKDEEEPSDIPEVGITIKPKPYCVHVTLNEI